jgi:hypothetical protein
MKWFNEHLNISYGLIILLTFAISIICLVYILRDLKNFDPALITIVIFCSILPFLGAIWVLWQKGQSMWWLLIYLVFSFALFVLVLVLPNNRQGQGEDKKISEADYYQQRAAGKQ